MSDQNEDENCETCGRPMKDSRDFATLKTRTEAAEARTKTLEATILSDTIRKAGFDPDLEITKMVAEKFDGDITASDATTAFAEFAKSKGLNPTVTEQTNGSEQQLDALQTQGDRLREASNPQTPPPTGDLPSQIAEAEAAGNWTLATSLKTQLLRERTPA